MVNKSHKHKLMITCKEATMLSVQKTEIKLSFSDRIRLFIHLIVCQYCRLFDKQMKLIDNIIANWKTDKKLSDIEKTQLQSIIEQEIK